LRQIILQEVPEEKLREIIEDPKGFSKHFMFSPLQSIIIW